MVFRCDILHIITNFSFKWLMRMIEINLLVPLFNMNLLLCSVAGWLNSLKYFQCGFIFLFVSIPKKDLKTKGFLGLLFKNNECLSEAVIQRCQKILWFHDGAPQKKQTLWSYHRRFSENEVSSLVPVNF